MANVSIIFLYNFLYPTSIILSEGYSRQVPKDEIERKVKKRKKKVKEKKKKKRNKQKKRSERKDNQQEKKIQVEERKKEWMKERRNEYKKRKNVFTRRMLKKWISKTREQVYSHK